jgi:starvation-inducible DNA-binding protein
MTEKSRTDALTAELQPLLTELTDLALAGKQAHWNVTGPLFLPVHQQLDDLVSDTRSWADQVAERIMALGGSADGRAATVAAQTPFAAMPAGRITGDKAIALMVERLDIVIAAGRRRIEALDDTDLVSQDLVIAAVAGLEKHRWMFSAQQR